MATPRFLTPSSGVAQLLRSAPKLHFGGRSRADWLQWRRRFRSALIRLLGPTPPRCRPVLEVLSRERLDGYVRERIVFNPDPFSSIPCYLLIPDGLARGERRPAVLCAHGHGAGKDDVVGLDSASATSGYTKRFAVALAQAGFVTIAPDWRSFGERRDCAHYLGAWGAEHGSDGCDLSYMTMGYFGYQLLGLDLADARRCLDLLCARPEVDQKRIGCMGCSFGGTMTTYTAALDPRVRAAVISGYLSTIEDAVNQRGRGNTCGSQFLLGLRAIGDISDVAGLIAPRPCQVQIGIDDTCFIESDAMRAFTHLRAIYRAAGAERALELDRFQGGHEVDLEPAVAFFQRHLG